MKRPRTDARPHKVVKPQTEARLKPGGLLSQTELAAWRKHYRSLKKKRRVRGTAS